MSDCSSCVDSSPPGLLCPQDFQQDWCSYKTGTRGHRQAQRRSHEGTGRGQPQREPALQTLHLGHPACRGCILSPLVYVQQLSKPTWRLCGKCWLAAWLKGGLTLQAGWGQVSPRSEEVSVASPSKCASGPPPPATPSAPPCCAASQLQLQARHP